MTRRCAPALLAALVVACGAAAPPAAELIATPAGAMTAAVSPLPVASPPNSVSASPPATVPTASPSVAPSAIPATATRIPTAPPPAPTAVPTPGATVIPVPQTPGPRPTWTATPNPAIPGGVSGCVPQVNGSRTQDCVARGLPPGKAVTVSVHEVGGSNYLVTWLPPVDVNGNVPFPYGRPTSGEVDFTVSAGGVVVTFSTTFS